MNVRYILRSSVIFACVLSVISSPIFLDERTMDLDARGTEGTPEILQLRELAYNGHGYDHISVPERRAPPLKKNVSGTKKVSKTRKALKPVANQTPKKKPGVDLATTPPKKPATPAPVRQKTANQAPPLRPNSQNSGKPPARAPPKATQPKNGASCMIKRGFLLSKRAFDTSCSTATLTLNGVTRSMTKVADQGQSSVTYQVDNGWPDSTGRNVLAFAKTGKRPTESFTEEINWLKKVGELLADGQYEGRNFIVFRGAAGKHIAATNYFGGILTEYLQNGEIGKCKEAIRTTVIPLIVEEAEDYVNRYEVLHTDIHPDNVMFTEQNGRLKATLIDWGRAEAQKTWTQALSDRVKAQAIRSFVEGSTGICVQL
ncbi:hypothetical protein ONZ45_g11735 [Pleurotus djamor]|nr:hypothetical protein ONZ45_g11735 [Pleurotus djamor]